MWNQKIYVYDFWYYRKKYTDFFKKCNMENDLENITSELRKLPSIKRKEKK